MQPKKPASCSTWNRMKSKLKIAGAALNQTPIDWQHNTTNILRAIKKAEELKADILCLPELCLSGYGCEDLFLSEWLSSQAWEALKKIVPQTGDMIVCIGLPIRLNGHTYNGICVVHNKTVLGITLKQNLARDGVHYEPRWFEPWPSGLIDEIEQDGEKIQVGDLVYECKGVIFGFEICEDAWRQIRPADKLCQRGVDLILNPSASHFALGKSISRELLVTESSSRYHCAYGYVNLLGNEAGRMIYDGDILFAREGKILHRSPRLSFSPCVVEACEIDFEKPTTIALEEEHIDRNEEFAQATALALFDYLRKSKSKGFVLSLSGGADSACCAVIVAEMVRRAIRQLGWNEFKQVLNLTATQENEAVRELLTCAYQATRNSSTATLEAAQQLALSIKAAFHHWQVDDEVESYKAKIENSLDRQLTWEQDDIALQNIQARSRSPIVWLLANIKNCILLTASNRSEGDVGYATMDGDTSGSLAPIAGIDKPFIRQWLKWAQKELSYSGLHAVNNLQPTAELRPADRSQTDESDLMPYDLLLAIEKLAIHDRKPPVVIYNLLSNQFDSNALKSGIKKFFRLWAANQWKRERLAPSFHLDDFNIDPRSWCRFPILSGNFQQELSQLDRI